MLTLYKLRYTTNQNSLYDINVTFLHSSITYFVGISKLDKMCLLKIIANIQKPVNGHVIVSQEKPYCLYLSNNFGLNNRMTVFENLKFWARLYNSIETMEASICYFGLQNVLDVACSKLSVIDKKKVVLSKLISCQSDIWLLDEIESDIDIDTKKLLQNLIISKANNGGIILITPHHDKWIETAQILNIEDYRVALNQKSYSKFI